MPRHGRRRRPPISEHAFGNALDIAGFTLADGRNITVKNGWHGTPEEQGFLHDVQLYACETFSTVLAPGYNVYHYDHIHVDLMRREQRPASVPAGRRSRAKSPPPRRARFMPASIAAPAYTGSIAAKIGKTRKAPVAVPGADGYVADVDDDAGVTGSIARPSAPAVPAAQRPQNRLTQIY